MPHVPRLDRLPPPPAVPPRSPPVAVAGEVETRLSGLFGGPAIEARLHVPPDCVRAVVICHPHPLYGGSMHSPLSLAIAKRLSESTPAPVGWARFNFRGVCASEGAYDEGRAAEDGARPVIG